VLRFILLALLLLLLARAFWRLMDGVIEAAGGTSRSRAKSPSVRLVRDPVCGTYVAPGKSLSLSARGTTHHFCSEKCRTEFQSRPS
jgi:YHS domain-containing protein